MGIFLNIVYEISNPNIKAYPLNKQVLRKHMSLPYARNPLPYEGWEDRQLRWPWVCNEC